MKNREDLFEQPCSTTPQKLHASRFVEPPESRRRLSYQNAPLSRWKMLGRLWSEPFEWSTELCSDNLVPYFKFATMGKSDRSEHKKDHKHKDHKKKRSHSDHDGMLSSTSVQPNVGIPPPRC
jgi:predicted ATP-binding protein involved in virulence